MLPSPSVLAKWEGILLLGGLACIILWKIADGSISLDQLFDGDSLDPDSGAADGLSSYASAGRTQAFLVTLFVAAYYLRQVIANPTHFPEIPNALVLALGGSQILYLGGKARALLGGKLRDFFLGRSSA